MTKRNRSSKDESDHRRGRRDVTDEGIDHGQFLLGHFKSLLPMPRWVFHSSASTGSFKSKETINALHHGDHIDDMTKKWLALTPNPTRIPVFYTLTNIHKPNPVGRPIISGCPGCEGPTERISSCGSPTSAYC